MKKYLAWLLSLMLFLQVTACGTILYPERRGQATTGKIDVSVVILDAIGLIFFLVPGVVAFATDFATGAIYLPPGGSSEFSGNQGNSQSSANQTNYQTVQLEPGQITKESIEQAIYEQTGQSINLDDENLQMKQLDNYDGLNELFRSVDDGYTSDDEVLVKT